MSIDDTTYICANRGASDPTCIVARVQRAVPSQVSRELCVSIQNPWCLLEVEPPVDSTWTHVHHVNPLCIAITKTAESDSK